MKIQFTTRIGLAIFGAFATTVSGQTKKAPNVVFVLADE